MNPLTKLRYPVAILLLFFIMGEPSARAQKATPPHRLNARNVDRRLCGAESLYIVFRCLGKGPDRLQQIVQELGPAEKKGYSLQQLADLCQKFGLHAQCVSAGKDAESLRQLTGRYEVILRLSAGHYVVCSDVKGMNAIVVDGMTGPQHQAMDVLQNIWDGDCLLVSTQPIEIDIARPSLVRWALIAAALVVATTIAAFSIRKRLGWSR
jgi:ABC-type bacteriocin/lantibiotic exporter with double-glycine peptidase domain